MSRSFINRSVSTRKQVRHLGMGIMRLTLARNWQEPMEPWLIQGFLSGTRTLLSGEPKLGKTMLAGHLASSLIHQSPFLGIQPQEGFHRVAWMGFDASWQAEYKAKFPFEVDHVYFAKSLNYREMDDWISLGEDLIANEITLFVVDHLYGLAGDLDLDESHEMTKALAPVLSLQESTKIPLLLIAHAGKNGTGRAAHSTYLEAQFRHLIRLTGSTRGSRREITSMGNLWPSSKFVVNLSPRQIELTGSNTDNRDSREYERTEIALRQAKIFLAEAPSAAKRNFTQAGKWFAERKISANEEAGRTLAKKLKRQELLEGPTENNPEIRAGRKLLV